MKTLFLTIDRTIRVATHFAQFQEAMKRLGTDMISKDIPNGYKHGQYAGALFRGEIKTKNKLTDNHKKYDAIITDADFAFLTEDWNKFNAIKGMIVEDSPPIGQGHGEHQVKWANKNKFDVAFYKYKVWMERNGKNFNGRTFWMPHSININLFKDYGLKKKYDVLMTGHHSKLYRTRHAIFNQLQGENFFTAIGRPAEIPKGNVRRNKNIYEGKSYAQLLNQAKISIADGVGDYRYPVMKFFEIPASRTCLVSNWWDELGDLGFIPNENMVIADENDVKGQMKYLLESGEWKRIADNGYKLIRERHSTDIRTKEMMECLRKI